MAQSRDRSGRRWFTAPAGAALLVVALASYGIAASSGAKLSLSPTSGPPGTIVAAKGRAFPAAAKGKLTFGETVVARFKTNNKGRFETTFAVPAGYEGRTRVTATARRVSGKQTFTVTTVSPSPDPSPDATPTASPTASPGLPPPDDALVRRVRAELKTFTDWLSANDVDGTIGEFGWPNNFPADQPRYNALAEQYVADMRAAGLVGTQWATGEWWGPNYELSAYSPSSVTSTVDTPRGQAPVYERHTDIAGIHVNGGEFGAPSGATPVSTFSNVNPGAYETAWHYDRQATFDYLASKGTRQVVIPFRWERVQPTPGGALNTIELGRIKDAITRARTAGMTSIPMVANYGAYWLHNPLTGMGVRQAVGSAQITITHYADLWTKLSTALATHPGIAAYGLMREPAGLPGLTTRAQARVWEEASQAAVTAIRTTGDTRSLLVPGYQYSNTHSWPTQHPTKWITDPANNHVYEAHHYWDLLHEGTYRSYDEEVLLSTVGGVPLDLPGV